MQTQYYTLDQIEDKLFPGLAQRRRRILRGGIRLAYYTTADVAKSILETKRIWMRNTQAMNDSSEVAHGFQLLKSLRSEAHWQDFMGILNRCSAKHAGGATNLFHQLEFAIREQSYITCFTEHRKDDNEGLLSMWRAYGGTAGVALILKGQKLIRLPDGCHVNLMPLDYMRAHEFGQYFSRVLEQWGAQEALLATLGPQDFTRVVVHFLRMSVLCSKHPAFAEEREWRAIFSPNFAPFGSSFLDYSIEVVRGMPQRVYKMNFDDKSNGINGIDLYSQIEKIIIGPCQFPAMLGDALKELLLKGGCQNPDEIVVQSGIPLRHF